MRISIFTMAMLLFCLPAGAQSSRSASSKPKPTPAPFTLTKRENVWWLVAPDGKPFFSFGVCCVNPGIEWGEYNLKNPGYSAWKQYPDAVSWADTTIERMRSWGFTTIGGWSDYAMLKRSSKMTMPYAPVLHLGSSSGAPWYDMWDPKVIQAMDDTARKQIEPVRNDPRLLGYYTDNELGWWNAPLFQMTLEHKPQSGQRQRLIRLLRAHYQNDWTKLRQDFLPDKADSFSALERGGKLYLRPGGKGMPVVKSCIRLIADRYYALVRQIVRKYDRRGLILGDRYQSFYYPEVVQASRRYVDVVSTNCNAHWNGGEVMRCYLDTLHALTNKPVLIGEFYMAAMENRSGNKNSSSGFPVVPTQQERAANSRVTLEHFLRAPYVVGADWFQYYDEPTHGRGDGENFNMGLVDIEDKPYTELTATFAALDLKARHAAASPRPDVSAGVPPAPPDPMGNWKSLEAMRSWDRERGFVPPKSRHPLADLTLCWDKDAVYVGLYAIDIAEDGYYKDKRVPETDRAQWILTLNGKKPSYQARMGAGRPLTLEGGGSEAPNFKGLEDGVRSLAVARLPAALFGKESLRAGDTIQLASTFLTFARAYKMEWAGKFTLAE